jgi:MYXO-CTERM domain-containing protein
MSAFRKLALTAAFTLVAAPAWASLTYTSSGSYNLGGSTSAGATAATGSSCGINSGRDTSAFVGDSADNNIGIHAYACDDSASFGTRASGEHTYYAQGIASVTGQLSIGEADFFSFSIDPGEVGAFGSTSFVDGEFQQASLTIKLVITDATGHSVTYLDEAWSAGVGTGGAITNSYASLGSLSLATNSNSGAGYYSYGIAGKDFDIALDKGDYDISYVLTSTAYGNISQTGVCTAYLQGNRGQEGASGEGTDGPATGQAFTSYCGAGARTGDPFPGDGEPIARALAVNTVPEPMSAGLALTALLAAAGVRRRTQR